jgi:hypothetical protein
MSVSGGAQMILASDSIGLCPLEAWRLRSGLPHSYTIHEPWPHDVLRTSVSLGSQSKKGVYSVAPFFLVSGHPPKRNITFLHFRKILSNSGGKVTYCPLSHELMKRVGNQSHNRLHLDED